MLLDIFYYVAIDVVGFMAYFVIQVRTVERRFERRCLLDAKVLHDVILNLHGSSGCEGNDRSRTYLVDDWTYVTVFGTEVVTPF